MNETRHLGVYGLIMNEDKIALVKKSRGAYKGKLDLPGGSFEYGEKPEETLIREINEELGTNVKSYKIFDSNSVVVDWIHHHSNEHMHHIGIFYLVTLDSNNLMNDFDGHDSLGANWYNISGLKEEDVSPLTWIELEKLRVSGENNE